MTLQAKLREAARETWAHSAPMLGDAADALDVLQSELAAAQEALKASEAIAEQCRTDTEIAERHQAAAEALAESYRKDAERWRALYLEGE